MSVLNVALAKHFSKLADKLEPGTHQVRAKVVVEAEGTVTVGESVEYTPTVAVPLLPTLALVLEKAGFMRDHAAGLLVSAMTEALALEAQGEKAIKEKCRLVNEAMARVREITGALPKAQRAGPTKVDVRVNVAPAGWDVI